MDNLNGFLIVSNGNFNCRYGGNIIVAHHKSDRRQLYLFDEFAIFEDIPEEISSTIKYYLETYESYMHKPHPRLKDQQWERIVRLILIGEDDPHNHLDLNYENMIKIIDQHFVTEYSNCDYNINHFVSGKIILNRFYEACY